MRASLRQGAKEKVVVVKTTGQNQRMDEGRRRMAGEGRLMSWTRQESYKSEAWMRRSQPLQLFGEEGEDCVGRRNGTEQNRAPTKRMDLARKQACDVEKGETKQHYCKSRRRPKNDWTRGDRRSNTDERDTVRSSPEQRWPWAFLLH